MSSTNSFNMPDAPDGLRNPSREPGARCLDADPEQFFPMPSDDWSAAEEVCSACPIRTGCGQWAIATRQSGVWGGMLLDRGRPEGVSRRWRNPYPVRKAS